MKPDDARAAGATEEVLSGEVAEAVVAATPRAPGTPLSVPEIKALIDAIGQEGDTARRGQRISAELVPVLATLDPIEAEALMDRVCQVAPFLKRATLDREVSKARKAQTLLVATSGEVEIENARELTGILTLDNGTVYALARRTLRVGTDTVRAMSVLTWNGTEARILDGTGDNPVPVLPDGAEILLTPGSLPERCPTLATLRRFADGERVPGPVVFDRVQRFVRHFLDLGAFPGGQDTAELVLTAWCLSTWWQRPARLVASYVQFTGPKGSGKSRALAVAAEVVLAGELVLSSTSNAALRDLCAAGACLLLDEAEDLAHGRQNESGQDRRGLLLGGTRPGMSWALKEATPDGRWETRRVPIHGPRGFASIAIPEAVLGSRALRIPMVRTADPARARRDPALDDWPEGETREDLRDALALWALGTLRDAPMWYGKVRERLPVFGRDAEPWLPPAAVCLAVDAEDGGDRFGRIMEAIQGSQEDTPDREREVLAALVRLWESGTLAPGPNDTRIVPVSEVAEKLDDRREDEDGPPDEDARRRRHRLRIAVGRTLRDLRIGEIGRLHGGKSAFYVAGPILRERCEAYGVPPPPDLTNLTRPIPMRESGFSLTSPESDDGEVGKSAADPRQKRPGEVGEVDPRGDPGKDEVSGLAIPNPSLKPGPRLEALAGECEGSPGPCLRCGRAARPDCGAERLLTGELVCGDCLTPEDLVAGSVPVAGGGAPGDNPHGPRRWEVRCGHNLLPVPPYIPPYEGGDVMGGALWSQPVTGAAKHMMPPPRRKPTPQARGGSATRALSRA